MTIPETEAEHLQRLLREAAAVKGVSLGKDAWRRLRRNRVAMAALVYLVGLALLAFLAPILPLQPPAKINATRQFETPRLSPLFEQSLELLTAEESAAKGILVDPGSYDKFDAAGFGPCGWLTQSMLRLREAIFGKWTLNSVCGRDELGRDLLARICWGSRVSLLVALVAAGVALLMGVTYGSIAGYIGGWVDNLMMRAVDILYSIPLVFVVIFLITILSEDTVAIADGKTLKQTLDDFGISRISIFFVVIGLLFWLTMARVVRGQVLSLKNEQFVEAARSIGASQFRIIFIHIVPNLFSVIIVYLTLTIPQVMLFEAFLSFLGLGVAPPDVSWGILADEGIKAITPIKIYWWLVLFPSLALAMTLFALNFLGDGLRDALDPRLKNR